MNILPFFFKRGSYLLPVFFLFLLIFHFSCFDDWELKANASNVDNNFTVDSVDRPRKRIPVSVEQTYVSNREQFEIIPQKSRPVSLLAYDNIQLAVKPAVIPITEELTQMTPGENGVPIPRSISVQGQLVLASQPKPDQALPPRIKEAAQYDLQYLDVDQGMISSYLRFLLEDSQGFLWIATSYGVSRYNGRSFVHYTTEHGLMGNSIWTMLEDSRGYLWFGTDNGVSFYDGHQFIHYRVELGTDRYQVRAMLEDKEGNLWFGTSQGVLLYKRSENDRSTQGEFIHYSTREGLINNGVQSILEDSRGDLWFGTVGGLCRYNPPDDKLQDVNANDAQGSFIHYKIDEGFADEIIPSIEEDAQGKLWFATLNGVFCYTPPGLGSFPEGSFTRFTTKEGLISNQVYHILKDDQENLWFAWTGGVSCFNGSYFIHYREKEGASKKGVRHLLQDSYGNLWFATGGEGIYRLNPNSFSHLNADDHFSSNDFTSVTEDKQGNLWFGTDGAVIRYNGSDSYTEGMFTYYTVAEGLIHREVLSVMGDRQGNVWIGTSGGVSCFTPDDSPEGVEGRGSFVQFTTEDGLVSNEVKSFLEDSHGNIWFITTQGVSCYDGKGMTQFTTEEGLISNRVRSMLEDSQGNIWFATSEGVSRFDSLYFDEKEKRGQFTHFTTKEGLAADDIRAILEDQEGNIWFGTYGKGLSCYNPEKDQFIHYTTKDGLSNNVIWSLVEDKQGNIWISTEKGITLMKKRAKEGQDWEFFTFKKEEGLTRLDFQENSALLDQQDRLWWGTLSGLTMLDLTRFKLPENPPKSVQLTHIEINQKFVDYRQLSEETYRDQFEFGEKLFQSFDSVAAFSNYPATMTLPSKLNHLTFYFSAIDWRGFGAAGYQYFLEGLEEEWSYPNTEPKADYRNLSHGTYTLRVRACGETPSSGKWSETFEYPFTILPPWWLTWWAYLLYLLIFAGITYVIFSFFKRRWLLQNALALEREEAIRLQELDRSKNRFFTNVSHELRTPLTLLTGPINALLNEKRLTERQTRLLQIANQSGKQLKRLVTDILDLSKLEMGKMSINEKPTELFHFFRRYFAQFASLAERKQIDLSFDIDIEEGVVAYIDQEKCRQILYNLLSNAFKFTPAEKRIVAKVFLEEGILHLDIADSGPGIHPDDLPHLFDRYFQTNRPDKPAEGGTGIGLALCYEYARLFGGNIEVDSTLGKGTRFCLIFPVSVAKNHFEEGGKSVQWDVKSQTPNEGQKLKQEPPLPHDESKPTILVVEDNPDLQDYIGLLLSEKYHLVMAGNGEEALKALMPPGSPPSLILSDLMMPVMDGYQLLDKLKSEDTTRHIPVILLTARADIKDKLKALRIGVDDYLHKPFVEEELLVRIENLIKNREARIPEQPGEEDAQTAVLPISKTDQEWLETFESYIRKNLSNDMLSIPVLAEEFAMSESTLLRQLKRLTGLSPLKYLHEVRLNRARDFLENRTYNSISKVAYEVGYSDARSFSRRFKKRFGKLPSAFFEE